MKRKEAEALKEKVIEDFNKALNDKSVENVVSNFIGRKSSVSDPGKEEEKKERKWDYENTSYKHNKQ